MKTGNSKLAQKKEYPRWLFILLPAITMLLGWGLRGFIGGGPFGAMIPGAMLMLALSILLDIPANVAAVMIVFSTAGVGMGGEMTYGQTLGFLRNPDTVLWGTCGTTVKGGVWGLVGGTFIGLGLVHRSIKTNTLITGFLLFLCGFVIGLKLINDPKLIYFSDPINKPRQESWAGLLFAAIALLTFLKVKVPSPHMRLIVRFASFGLAGGALGFGLGAFWLVLGSHLPKNDWITDWWKLMEFSFGFIIGGFFGYAAWLSRKEISATIDTTIAANLQAPYRLQLVILLLVGIFIYLGLPLLEPFVESNHAGGPILQVLRTITRVLVNFTFIGTLLIVVALRWPLAAFQLAVTLTFTHTMIDLVEDIHLPLFRSPIVVLAAIVISFLVALLQRKQRILPAQFLLLIWSTLAVAIGRMIIHGQFTRVGDHSLLKYITGDLLVFDVFTGAAIIISLMIQHATVSFFTSFATNGENM